MSISAADIAAQFRKMGQPVPADLKRGKRPHPADTQCGPLTCSELCVTINLATRSEPNSRSTYRTQMRRKKYQRESVCKMLDGLLLPPLPVDITIVRIGPKLIDVDNAWASIKFSKDGIAQAYGVDDANARFHWEVDQEKGPYGVRIEIRSRHYSGKTDGCHSDRDGDCFWKKCPQNKDGEPHNSGRHCPLDNRTKEEE